ncbi:SGNH/GDSL hydrolase family protein [Roseicyclus sp. F158]|uniref:SGNH/GDSL hydrolase family protein n=1 Tax=Tropicimonas omnivorans TaxID=3075590 RepID=A0ABU3DHG6_9RHOB|nr:SGNH/GDSL hydrolase family protein [Roseicyclus sp. F158]MDT0683156.1 SGNH/GDSL hydrolase family protein [Roseicyclus sp. F158]
MKRWLVFPLLLLAACGRGVPDEARVVVAGDSVMAWNRDKDASVADTLNARLGEPVGDVSMPGARMLGGFGPFNIPSQLDGVTAEWIVLDGGANDLRSTCDCSDCGPVLDRLISEDGMQGAIPALVADLRRRGSRVVWTDYYTTPLYAGTVCEAPYQVLEARVRRMADADAGVDLADMDDVFSSDDLSLFDDDRTHPSQRGSSLIAELVAPLLDRRN